MIPIRYFVVKCQEEWRVEFEDSYRNGFKSKKDAIKYAIDAARTRSQKEDRRCEVLVQEEDQLWYTAWTSPEQQ